jgi:hypothetical protein
MRPEAGQLRAVNCELPVVSSQALTIDVTYPTNHTCLQILLLQFA